MVALFRRPEVAQFAVLLVLAASGGAAVGHAASPDRSYVTVDVSRDEIVAAVLQVQTAIAAPANRQRECGPIPLSSIPLESRIPDFLTAVPGDAVLYESLYDDQGMLLIRLLLPCSSEAATACEFSLEVVMNSGRCIGYRLYEVL